MASQKEKCETFAALHQQAGAFVIPNPWDAGSARLLQGLGYQALATTSAGLAFTLGRTDGEVTLAEKLAHCSSLVSATDIPINADFENGFADSPEEVAENVLRVAETGIAGCSIEDFSRDAHTLYDFNFAVERVAAAVEALAHLDMPFQLTARAENLLRNVDNEEDTVARLKAFEAVGADVLYAPGIKSLDQLQRISAQLKQPFNVLSVFFQGVSVDDFAASGAKRISVGGALHWAALGPILSAGREMLDSGTFAWTKDMPSGSEIKKLLV